MHWCMWCSPNIELRSGSQKKDWFSRTVLSCVHYRKQLLFFKYEAKQHHSLMRWTWFRTIKVIPINPCQHFTSATTQPIKQSEQPQHSFKLQWLINICCYLQVCIVHSVIQYLNSMIKTAPCLIGDHKKCPVQMKQMAREIEWHRIHLNESQNKSVFAKKNPR